MGFFNFSRSNSKGRSRGNRPQRSAGTHPSEASRQRPAPPKPRKEPRYTVPIFSIKIRVEFFLGDLRYVGYLWDVSVSGACVQSHEPIPASGKALVCLHDHASEDKVERMVTLIWSDFDRNAYYVGLSFDEPLDDDCGFLRNLLNLPPKSPTSRLSKLGPVRLNPWPV